MRKIIKPDYNNCILNIISSILKHFSQETPYTSLDILDNALSKEYKNVVLMIFDGLGLDVLKHSLSEDSFLRRNMKTELTSVFPSTTTAAMTSYYSGLSPLEHSWLGWTLYFKEFNGIIDTYPNNYSYSKKDVGKVHAAFSIMPYKTIFEMIKEKSNETGIYTIMPEGIIIPGDANQNIEVDSIRDMAINIERLCAAKERKFVMSYWPEPDSIMHYNGCYIDKVKTNIRLINNEIEAISKNFTDTLLIISADHGLIDIKDEIFLNDIPEIDECLIMPPSIESRAVSLFVKPEMLDVFEERCNRYFADDFILITKEEVVKCGLLGRGIAHRKISDFLGNFLAIGIGNKMIRYRGFIPGKRKYYLGQHAGFTEEEMIVPLIFIEK